MTRRTGSGRRGFLLGIGRGVLALLLGGGVGAMILRDGNECVNQGLCHGCAVLDTCRLPEAMSARQARRGQREEE